MASETVTMPELGESVMEGVIVEWLVKPGDHVGVDDPLCEVETDKANAEVPSPIAGYITEILVQEDDVVEVGNGLVVISDEKPEGLSAAPPQEGASATPAASKPASPSPAPSNGSSNGAQSSPPVMSLNISAPPATPGANITTGPPPMMQRPPQQTSYPQPVQAPTPQPSRSPSSAKSDRWLPFGHPEGARAYRYPQPRVEEGDTVEKFTRRRHMIAEHMVISQAVTPHVVTVAEVDMTNAVELRAQHKGRLKSQGIRLTYFAFMLKATCEALREFPIMNSIVGDKQVIQKGALNLGFAAETEQGLVVPVIRNADELNLIGLAKAVDRLATKARNNKLEPNDVTGGTFTVSNPGLRGNLYGGAIINQPQVGILRMGEMKKRPMVVTRGGQDVIAIRQMMYLALSYDHRVIDGVTGNGFLFRVRELLEAANFHVG
ncbi:MAG: dihydrolipoamide acetyltransferase family protein [Myxococcota bacterium]